MAKQSLKLQVQGTEITLLNIQSEDYISLTDMAKGNEGGEQLIYNWMRTRYTVEFLGIWEGLNNAHFNPIEFERFKNEAGSNTFLMTPKKWVEATNAIGIFSKAGRYGGGTFAHRDIAFEFGTWLSPQFKIYLIKEFQRIKKEEQDTLQWEVKRILSKLNYHIHTDAVKSHLIPQRLGRTKYENTVYASEADVLNMAVFGLTAKEWQNTYPEAKGNIRDNATVEQLLVLANIENLNAEFIKEGLSQAERVDRLNEIAIYQLKLLIHTPTFKQVLDITNTSKP